MNLSRWKSLLALLFAFSLLAAACAGDEEGADEGTETAADEDSADEAEDPIEEAASDDGAEETDEDGGEAAEGSGDLSGTSVTITGPERDESEAGALQQALDAFGEENGIDITYTGSADWEAEINIAVEAGNAPDISIFPQPGKLADFARDGFVQPLPDDVAESVASNWDDSWMAFGDVDGTQYGVPNKSDLKSLVWYKPARFEELGYEIPETWDELVTLTETAAEAGDTPWCVGIESGQATGWPFTDWTEDLMLRFHGADAYDQWVAGDLDFASDEVQEVFNAVNDLWTIDGAVFASGGSIAATAFQDNGQGLVDDSCLMHRQASFFSAFIPEGTPFADGSPEAVDVFYFPPVDADSRPVLGAGTLAGAFEDRPEVWAVMEYLGTPEFANARQQAQAELKGGGASGFLSAVNGADSSLYTPLEQSFLEILGTAEVVRFDASDLMPADVGAGTFWSEGTSFVNGDIDAATAGENIDASWPG